MGVRLCGVCVCVVWGVGGDVEMQWRRGDGRRGAGARWRRGLLGTDPARPRHPPAPAGNSADGKGKAAVGGGAGGSPAELALLQHTKVVNAAYFSPITGGGRLCGSLGLVGIGLAAAAATISAEGWRQALSL